MGRGDLGPVDTRFLVRTLSPVVDDDFWIEDAEGGRVFKIEGSSGRLGRTLSLRDTHGVELAKVQDKRLSLRQAMSIERGTFKASVRKTLVGLRPGFTIAVAGGEDLKATGNLADHEYTVTRGAETTAVVSTRWFGVVDGYGVEVSAGEDAASMLAIAVCLDAISR